MCKKNIHHSLLQTPEIVPNNLNTIKTFTAVKFEYMFLEESLGILFILHFYSYYATVSLSCQVSVCFSLKSTIVHTTSNASSDCNTMFMLSKGRISFPVS